MFCGQYKMIDFYSVTALLLCGLVFLLYTKRRSSRRTLPGPKGYPIIGNMLDVNFEKLHLKLFDWSKQHGDIFQFTVLGSKIAVLNSSDVIRELFSKEPYSTATSKRPDSFLAKYCGNYADVIFSPIGKTLIQRRKFLHQALHVYGEGMKYVANQMTLLLSDMAKDITHKNKGAINPEHLIDDFILGTLQVLIIGNIPRKRNEVQKHIIEMNHIMNVIAGPSFDILYSTFPFLRFTSLPGAKAYRKAMEKKDGLMKMFDSNMEKDSEHEGIYQHMLEVLKERSVDWFTDENLLTFLAFDVVFAGYMTTRNMLVTLTRVLLSAPETQKKLQDEVDAVIGRDRKPLLADRYNMPYSEAVVLETFRYISHVPLASLHETAEDIEFRGYHIPKGTPILPNLWAAHHMEKDWEKPFEFDPSRFLDDNGQVFPADHPTRKKLVTFGSGRRGCIGEVFARTRIFFFITTLMQICTIVPVDGKVPPMLDPYEMLPGGVQKPPDFKCKLSPRL